MFCQQEEKHWHYCRHYKIIGINNLCDYPERQNARMSECKHLLESQIEYSFTVFLFLYEQVHTLEGQRPYITHYCYRRAVIVENIGNCRSYCHSAGICNKSAT